MTYWKLLATVLAFFVLLNYVIFPKMTSAWKANRSTTKIAKTGLLAGVELARDLAFIASVMYAGFAALLLLSLLLPANLALINGVIQVANRVHSRLDEFKKLWDIWYFTIPAAALIYLHWRTQRSAFAGSFRKGVNLELDRLNEERLKKPADWDNLPPDSAMEELTVTIEELRDKLESSGTESGDADRRKRQRVLRQISQLEEQRAALDYERRIDPRTLACEQPEAPPKTFLGRVRRGLLSKGFFQDLKGFGKILPRASFAVMSVAMIGVASSSGLPDVVRSRIIHFDDLRVQMVKAEVEKQWKEVVESPRPVAPAEPSLNEEDRRALNHLTNQFAQALSRNPSLRSLRASTVSREVRRNLARREVLANVDLPEGPGKRAATFADDADSLTQAERQVVEDVAHKSGTPESRLGQKMAAREKQVVSAMGSRWEKVKASVLNHAATYAEPVRPADLRAALIDRMVATAVESTVPVDVNNEVEKLARSTLSSTLKKSVNEAVEVEFKRTLLDLAGDSTFEEAMARASTRPTAIPRSDADELVGLLTHEKMPQVPDLESKIQTQRNWRNIPDALGDEQEAQRIADEVAKRTTQGGRVSLSEDAVDALAKYDDHFPSGGGGGGRFGGDGHGAAPTSGQARTVFAKALDRHRVAADAGIFQKMQRVRVQRASSFRMLRGFSRVGGVLIGEEPENPTAVLAFRDLQWKIAGREVMLILQRRSGATESFGPFDKSLVHQALAYAADGRPVAVTMTKARPLTQLKIHLHPSLLDSPLGCRVTELDRFVDTFTRERLPERHQLTRGYQTQFDVYSFAWAHRLSAAFSPAALESEPGVAATIKRTLSQPSLAVAVEATLRNTALISGPASVFNIKPEFFDTSLVTRIRSCAGSAKDAASFGSCIQKGGPDRIPEDGKEQSRLFAHPQFEPWSGVRERKFRITDDLAFLRAPRAGSSASERLWPFDFIIQIAFTSSVVDPPRGQNSYEYVDENPIEFRDIQSKIAEQVWEGIRKNNLQPMFKELQDFAILQRLIRQILAGRLGDDFPMERLGSLTRATAGTVPYGYTRRWNGSSLWSIQAFLLASVKSIEQRSDGWAVAARSGAQRCLTAFRNGGAREPLQVACDFTSVAAEAARACKGDADAACFWTRLDGLGSEIKEIQRMEYAFGVLKDEESAKGLNGCPALAPAVRATVAERRNP